MPTTLGTVMKLGPSLAVAYNLAGGLRQKSQPTRAAGEGPKSREERVQVQPGAQERYLDPTLGGCVCRTGGQKGPGVLHLGEG